MFGHVEQMAMIIMTYYYLIQLQMNFFRQIDTECEELQRFRCARFLSFLPIRDQPVAFSPASVSNVLKHLTCPLCKEMLNSPIYLTCSHRFCRQCIEKHTRGTMKKSCPLCMTPLVSKRDLRMDDVAIDLIDILMETFPIEAKCENKGRMADDLSRGRRKRQRTKPDTIELESEIDPPKKRRENPSLIQSWNQAESSQQSSSAMDTLQQSLQNAKVEQSSAEVEQPTKYEPQFSNNLNFSIQGFPIKDQTHLLCPSEQPSSDGQLDPPSQQVCLTPQQLKKQQANVSISRQSSQSSVLSPVASNFNAYFRIKLVPQPGKIFTPVLNCDEILVPSDSKAFLISKFIATSLNISVLQVRLFVRDNGQFREVLTWQGVSQLNHLYWLADQEIAMLSLEQMIADLTLSKQRGWRGERSCMKALFFCIDFQKRPPQRKPKK